MAAGNDARRPQAVTLGVLACLALSLVATASTTAGEGLAVVGATVFDGTGGSALKDAILVVEKDKIRSLGPRSLVALPKGVPYIDGRGRFVVPGRVREPGVAAGLRSKVRGGATFERALADALRAFDPAGTTRSTPMGTLEVGGPADLQILGKDPRESLANLGSVERAFVAGREVAR